jgi:hypothetical protein
MTLKRILTMPSRNQNVPNFQGKLSGTVFPAPGRAVLLLRYSTAAVIVVLLFVFVVNNQTVDCCFSSNPS